ncbi:MAG: carbonic anhydrase [Muribaculaceae bacterium]|nr:carbonic anhydrase [Muribaculaceae bacterium]
MREEIKKHNEKFVAEECYKPFVTSKYPDKKIAIVTCMDTRLVELLPAALGIKNGDVKMIKNAGGVITDPWDSTLRSLLVGIYELGVEEIMIIGHTGCGVEGMEASEMIHLMEKRGISPETISLIERCGIDLKKWLTGFEDTAKAVADSVELVKNHPLIPADVKVDGYIMDSTTGKLQALAE